jgi:hypothetical protein
MKLHSVMLIGLLMLQPISGAANDPLSSGMLFEGTATVHDAKGKTQRFQIGIRRLYLDAEEDGPQVISISTLSIMTICSGRIETIIDGKAVVRSPEDYWTVKADSSMKVKVLGESAILQTIAVTP